MEEINKKTLIEALSSLRDHEPPEDIWEQIKMELEVGSEELFPRKVLRRLPQYNPPAKVWNGVLEVLENENKPKIVQMRWAKPLAIAASLALLFAAYFIFQEPPNDEAIVLNYATEQIDDSLLEKDWKEDEEAFEVYHELCTAKKYICEHPEFQMLQQEFDELSEAINEIEMVLGDFGTNTDLISQIKDIELERTNIFKKMMVMLI